jgi:hypothetical protein
MKLLLRCGVVSLAALLAAGVPAQAQYFGGGTYNGSPGQYGPGYRPSPPLSPYLNLVNNGNPAINWYNQVQPVFQRRAVESQIEAALRNIQQTTPSLISGEIETLLRALQISEPLDATGHPVRFGDTTPYFGGARGPMGALGMGGQQTPPPTGRPYR